MSKSPREPKDSSKPTGRAKRYSTTLQKWGWPRKEADSTALFRERAGKPLRVPKRFGEMFKKYRTCLRNAGYNKTMANKIAIQVWSVVL